ncbi:uncharacterized protein LOC135211492 [Macrobrachium nipponense]|uniref:uncharacterized protein LOC135211492 n=1 Tax=Macrobrachium nipponense TaxID=159736 RepID=UPI0030C8B03F
MLSKAIFFWVCTEFLARNTEGSSPPAVADDEVLVLSLQESGRPSSESYARLLTPFPELRSFTVCYWLKLGRFREESTLMSYAATDDKDNEIRMDHRLTGYRVALRGGWAITDIQTPLRHWTHFCFGYTLGSDDWQIFVDGEKQAQGTMVTESGYLVSNGSYVIGQEQDSFGGGFQRDQSFSGEITELDFWDETISDESIKEAASGGLLVPQTDDENSLLYESSKDRAQQCSGGQGSSYMWLGANDEVNEGQWVSWATEEPIGWEGPWRGLGPNGGTAENCMVMLAGDFPSMWSDIACLDTYSFCVPCEFKQLTSLHLKGAALCNSSPFNQQYFLDSEKNGRPFFAGFFHSDIYWDPLSGSWTLQSLKEPGAQARWTVRNEGQYPFGTHDWILLGEVCGMLPGTVVPLTISVCRIGQFTCADGTCINLTSRCDLRVDCPDQSDESACSLLDIPEGYHTDIPPPYVKGEPLPVYFILELTSFPSIITQDLTLTANFKLSLRWRDLRINFLNLKDDGSLNVLPPGMATSIWTPKVFFSNAQKNVHTNLDQGARVECVRQGPSVPGPPSNPVEVNIFSGHENSIEMSQFYSVTYTCDFNLEMFPFDSQVCSLQFTMESGSSSYLRLIPVNNTYRGRRNLIEYTINI